MLYREAGQYKTSYAAAWRCFRCARTASASRSSRSRLRISAGHQRLHAAGGADPVPGVLARGDRAQHPHRLHRAALARHRRLHGGRRLCLLQAHDASFRSVNIIVWILGSGFFSAAVGALFGLPSLRIKGFYLAVATLAAQFFLAMVLHPRAVALQLQRLRRDRGADAHAVRRSDHRRDRDAGDALSRRAHASSSR